MQRRNYYKDDPRWIKARYRGRCHCGQEINPGDEVMYYPLDKKVACADCGNITEMALAEEDSYFVIDE